MTNFTASKMQHNHSERERHKSINKTPENYEVSFAFPLPFTNRLLPLLETNRSKKLGKALKKCGENSEERRTC